MNLKIASPCPMSWDALKGDNRVRFCERCRLNVYNIADMTETEVENLVARTEGRLCGTLYQRADGTAIRGDCPVGRMRKLLRRAAVVAAVLMAGAIGWMALAHADGGRARLPEWLQTVLNWIHPSSQPQPPRLLGEIPRP